MRDAPPMLPPNLDDGRLLECVVTSAGADGGTNVAPMGPIVDDRFERVLLRPFQSSTTFANLARERRCVLNVTDNVELIARAALDLFDEPPALESIPSGAGFSLVDSCRWHALEVERIDDSQPRAEILCRVTGSGRRRDFLGFNRAMHAVIEATILATRLHLTPAEAVASKLQELASPVEKTGGPRERRAFALVWQFVESRQPTRPA